MSSRRLEDEDSSQRRASFNFLDQFKKPGRKSMETKSKQLEHVSVDVLSSGSGSTITNDKRLEAAGATPSLKKMHAPIPPNFTEMTQSMSVSDESSGFDMLKYSNSALFQNRYPFDNTANEESGSDEYENLYATDTYDNESYEIQFQSDVSSSEDQTWSAPFAAAAKAVEKQQFQAQQQQTQQYPEYNEEVEKIWTSKDPITMGRHIQDLRDAPPPPPPPPTFHHPIGDHVLITASEDQPLIQISSPVGSTSSASSNGVGRSNAALLDDDTFDGDTLAGDDAVDGDTIGGDTVSTLDDDTLAGETYLKGDKKDAGFVESFFDDLAEVNTVSELSNFLFTGCASRAVNPNDEDDDDYTYMTDGTRLQQPERIGTWVGGSTLCGPQDNEILARCPTERLGAVNTEEWPLLARLKEGLSLNDDTAATKTPENREQSFFGPFFACGG